MKCTGIFFLRGGGRGDAEKIIAFWKTESNRCWHLDVASTRFLGRKMPENRTVKGEKNMIKVGKKTRHFHWTTMAVILLFICCCWGLLWLPCYGKIMWLSRDVMVAKETAVILYQSNHPLIGWLLNSCANIFVCGFGRKRQHFHSSWLLKDYVTSASGFPRFPLAS